MGRVSNLITDMTLKGASDDEIVRAVKHSMVVIDAPKHKLDYTRSEQENNIAELQELYQKKPDGKSGGASTLISRAKSPVYVDQRSKTILVDPETGEKIFKETGNNTNNKKIKKWQTINLQLKESARLKLAVCITDIMQKQCVTQFVNCAQQQKKRRLLLYW